MKRALIIIVSIVLAAAALLGIIAVIRKIRSKSVIFLNTDMDGEMWQ